MKDFFCSYHDRSGDFSCRPSAQMSDSWAVEHQWPGAATCSTLVHAQAMIGHLDKYPVLNHKLRDATIQIAAADALITRHFATFDFETLLNMIDTMSFVHFM